MIIKATYALMPLNVGNWLLHVGYTPFPLIFLNVSAFTVCSTSWTWQDFADTSPLHAVGGLNKQS